MECAQRGRKKKVKQGKDKLTDTNPKLPKNQRRRSIDLKRRPRKGEETVQSGSEIRYNSKVYSVCPDDQ